MPSAFTKTQSDIRQVKATTRTRSMLRLPPNRYVPFSSKWNMQPLKTLAASMTTLAARSAYPDQSRTCDVRLPILR